MNAPLKNHDVITLKIPLSRDVYKRVIEEAEFLKIPPGEMVNRMLRAVFESGDLIPLNTLRFIVCAATYCSVASMRQTETLKSEE